MPLPELINLKKNKKYSTCGQDLDVRVETQSQHFTLVPDHNHDNLDDHCSDHGDHNVNLDLDHDHYLLHLHSCSAPDG